MFFVITYFEEVGTVPVASWALKIIFLLVAQMEFNIGASVTYYE